MRVLSNIYPWYLPRRNTPLGYHRRLVALERQFPDITVELVDRPIPVIVGNVLFALHAAVDRVLPRSLHKTFPFWYFALRRSNWLPVRDIRAKRADVLYAFQYFPLNLSDAVLPIVCGIEMLPDECASAYGTSRLLRSHEIRLKDFWGRRCTLAITPSPGAAGLLSEKCPHLKGKVRVAPPYVPELEPVERALVQEKHERTGKLRVLFVGNEAKRKGLPALVRGLRLLAREDRARLDVTIVSRFLDGPVDVQVDGLQLRVAQDLPYKAVQDLMRASHILILPTYGDAFGLVLIEGMAAGCLVISSNREPQNWILDYGRAGLVVEPTEPESIAAALNLALDDRRLRKDLAIAGYDRFLEQFYHRVVGKLLRQYFEEAISIWHEKYR